MIGYKRHLKTRSYIQFKREIKIGTSVANIGFNRSSDNFGDRMAAKIILDLKGIISPLNLLKCKSCLKSMDKGDVLEVLLSDEDVANNLITIVQRSKDEIVYQKKGIKTICLGIKKGSRNYSDPQEQKRNDEYSK